MKRVELLEEIVKKQEKQIRLLTDFIKLVDESETIKNSFLPYCSIKDKLRRNNIEITDLKSQLAKAGEEKPIIKKCRQCRFFLDEHCEPCESCYPIAYSNWQPR